MAIPKNPITELKELHERLSRSEPKVTEPTYEYSPRRTAGFEAVCSYKTFKTYGVGTSKKTAQRDAASKMLIELPNYLPAPSFSSHGSGVRKTVKLGTNEMRHQPQNEADRKLAEAFFSKYSGEGYVKAASHQYPPSPETLAVCFSDINFGMKSPDAPKSETLLERLDKNMQPIECFEKVMNEFEFKFSCELAEVDPKKVGKVFVVLLKIDYHCLTIGGIGDTLGEAVESACQQAIDTFLLYMK